VSDRPEAEIDPATLDFTSCPVRSGDGYGVSVNTMMLRASEVHAIGSLGFAKLVFESQEMGVDIIPEKFRLYNILLPLTILRDKRRLDSIGYLRWRGRGWVILFLPLSGEWLWSCRFVKNGR
jgi:hypothetical protein